MTSPTWSAVFLAMTAALVLTAPAAGPQVELLEKEWFLSLVKRSF